MPILGRCRQTARLTFHVRSRSNFQKFLTVRTKRARRAVRSSLANQTNLYGRSTPECRLSYRKSKIREETIAGHVAKEPANIGLRSRHSMRLYPTFRPRSL